jgi:hypothetical protein
MKKLAVVVMVFTLLLSFTAALMAQEKAAEPVKVVHKYVGAAKCKICHNSPAKGEQYKKWSDSKHSKAFEVLGTPEALEVGKKAEVEKPQESDKCLVCHVIGFSAPAAAKDSTFTQTEGVGCEACHGPGSAYKDMKVMKDRAAAIAAGLNIPDEKTCLGCHNEKSPTYKEFVYADAVKLIAHPYPPKTEK